MIDFIYRLNEVLTSFPTGMRWTLPQISEATKTSVPHVLQYMSEGLDRDLEICGTLSGDEVSEAINYLSQKIRPQIEAREKLLAKRRSLALMGFERVTNKVRMMQAQNNWHGAFKTLVYFTGQHQEDLPIELLVTLCSDAVYVGIKAKANIQELGQWLQKAVVVAMNARNKDGIEEALDLVDAYGEYFLNEDSGKGPFLIGNILAGLEEPAARFELWEQYKKLVNQLYPMD